jgi:hypothetical protein
MTTANTVPRIIQRYFELASARDDEAYLALFAHDALVEDEGKEYAGIDAIRAWRRQAPRSSTRSPMSSRPAREWS